MPTLSKVQKHVNKKQGGKKKGALHENSRDARRLRRASGRDDKIHRISAVREKANDKFLMRTAFFRAQLPTSGNTPFTDAKIHTAIQSFLARDDAVLAELRAERRAGRPPSNKLSLMEQMKEQEAKEYEAGFWMPELRTEENIEALTKWKGDWPGLGQQNFIRVEKEGRIRESAFPPTGAA